MKTFCAVIVLLFACSKGSATPPAKREGARSRPPVAARSGHRAVRQAVRAVPRRRRQGLQGGQRAVARQPDVPRRARPTTSSIARSCSVARARRWPATARTSAVRSIPTASIAIVALAARARSARRSRRPTIGAGEPERGKPLYARELPEVPRRSADARRRPCMLANPQLPRQRERSVHSRTRSCTAGRARRWSRSATKLSRPDRSTMSSRTCARSRRRRTLLQLPPPTGKEPLVINPNGKQPGVEEPRRGSRAEDRATCPSTR